MEKYKVILDVDTGTDDAVAILMAMAAEEIDLLGICSVNGNRNVELTTDNTLRVVDFVGKGDEVKVYKGCALPLVCTLNKDRRPLIPYGDKYFDGQENHGNHLDLPETSLQPQDKCAVSYYIDTLMASEGDITIVAVGPLTNLAVAMRAEPRICSKIKEIMIMGAGLEEGNSGPLQRAEFNFWADPEAAEIVLQSGCKLTIVPLDVTHKTGIKLKEAQAFEDSGTKAGYAAATFIKRRIKNYSNFQHNWHIGEETAAVHDALCIAGLLDRSVFTKVVNCNMHMDYSGGTADGVSVVSFKPVTRDLDGIFRPAVKNVDLVMEADREKFAAIMHELVTK
ncbi:MAG: nucleoside hydrolase [Erysipelotrichaceae bacterium]|nr:nucleoside hydrolase [Erysipelotrichaceae bacterium]MBQ9987822.1 nucleoside hydrolase [Erysipelotrichales bacterium]MBR3693366.1 nucleoside hydrolase [Erysipelotrichales bacterium]